jgi:hypothetical protein
MEFEELFDMSIKRCPVAFECEKITTDNSASFTCDDGHMIWDEYDQTWYFRGDVETEQDKFPPGTYTIHLVATPAGNFDHTKRTTYEFTIPELCQSYVLEQFEPIVNQPQESFVMFHNDQTRVTYYNENRFFTTNPRVECGVWQVDYFLRTQSNKIQQSGLSD